MSLLFCYGQTEEKEEEEELRILGSEIGHCASWESLKLQLSNCNIFIVDYFAMDTIFEHFSIDIAIKVEPSC